MKKLLWLAASISAPLFAGVSENAISDSAMEIVGTHEPFASEAVYFVITDRFVDGDPGNNQVDQGGKHPTYDRPLIAPDGRHANIGYMGGDFRGLLNNADYIRDMGFSSVWISPIVDNPDEAFAGGDKVEFGGWGDQGKTGFHGYWGTNFYRVDEHWESPGLSFRQLTQALDNKGLKTVLDVVANHGSPSFSMPIDQPGYGEVYDAENRLLADHQNKLPEQLNPQGEPLHEFFHPIKDPHTAQLSNFNEQNPELQEYLINAYLHWIDQGADAFRIDTVKHMPHSFWKLFSERIRARHPGFFMFGESYNWEAEKLAEHTWPQNGGMSVLDFAGRQRMIEVFEKRDTDFSQLLDYLHLEDGLYANPYELMTFYDNHDMSRINADEKGFIDANNWLFTSRGIPVVYYGSEIGFMAGTREHEGNRNYFGQANVDKAVTHPIYKALKKVAHLRRDNIALQRGVQINLEFSGHRASFLRIYQKDGIHQTALVLLNKGDKAEAYSLENLLPKGSWTDAFTGESLDLAQGRLSAEVEAHGIRVLLFNQPINHPELVKRLSKSPGVLTQR
ncbi:cyclomaltodextrin glucanotransferase [Pseudomaricurvus alkylphenolicus]|uniref:alpha-amylase family glycosyl hydrolase n=1 Tax=Pseudomaricurvus alkylphenolicus TaxID=1306991 RepID=UPI00141E66CA|nr:alpha-amylase family glycosyl hydrolase [Pseudomaricurvus alkylphenolicus]NIB39606.1 cyclomaltodextrin glucanotransferase [Pseudomaricurvus alkylphenolicus]